MSTYADAPEAVERARRGTTFRLPFDEPAAPVSAHRDPKARTCEVCGERASYGFGVRLRAGVHGRWFCAAHRDTGERER